MPFNRWWPFWNQTFAYRLFKAHHTQFNQIFWASEAARVHSIGLSVANLDTDHCSTVFPNVAGNVHQNVSNQAWRHHYQMHDRWTRCAATMAIAGYLETFIAQISEAAIESCPVIVIGGRFEIDGVSQLKRQNPYSFFKEKIKPLGNGTWNHRAASYRNLFGSCPFEAHTHDLDVLRTIRNDTGHSFGRNIKSLQRAETCFPDQFPIFSDAQILGFLNLVDVVAKLVEDDLRPLVGSYELIRAYHQWRPTAVGVVGPKEVALAFSKHAWNICGQATGRSYGPAMIRHYEAA